MIVFTGNLLVTCMASLDKRTQKNFFFPSETLSLKLFFFGDKNSILKEKKAKFFNICFVKFQAAVFECFKNSFFGTLFHTFFHEPVKF